MEGAWRSATGYWGPDREHIALLQGPRGAIFRRDVMPVDKHQMHEFGRQPVLLKDLADGVLRRNVHLHDIGVARLHRQIVGERGKSLSVIFMLETA